MLILFSTELMSCAIFIIPLPAECHIYLIEFDELFYNHSLLLQMMFSQEFSPPLRRECVAAHSHSILG